MAHHDKHDKNLTERGIEDSMRGKVNKTKGKFKSAAGEVTGDRRLEAEGKWDQMKGKMQDALGKVERKLDRDDRGETP